MRDVSRASELSWDSMALRLLLSGLSPSFLHAYGRIAQVTYLACG